MNNYPAALHRVEKESGGGLRGLTYKRVKRLDRVVEPAFDRADICYRIGRFICVDRSFETVVLEFFFGVR